MTIRLDHTIVPVRDGAAAAAQFFAAVFGLRVKPGSGWNSPTSTGK